MQRLVLVPVAYALSLVLIHLALRKTGPARRASRNVRGLVAGGITLLFFLYINTVNRCAPGWCGEYGFPLTYSEWSDAKLILNGVNLSDKPFIPSTFAVDATIAALVILGVFLCFRGRSDANAGGEK
jgi:hypothetical protein